MSSSDTQTTLNRQQLYHLTYGILNMHSYFLILLLSHLSNLSILSLTLFASWGLVIYISITIQTTPDRRRLYSLTNRILNVQSLQFIPISLLFLPFTFSAFAALQFYFSSSPFSPSRINDVSTMFDPFNLFLIKTILASYQNLLTLKTLVTVLAFCCFVILPMVAGVALIIYNTNQAIHHQPVTFSSTLRSLSHSYIPLLHTVIAGSITLITLFIVFTLTPIPINEAFKALGFDIRPFIFPVFTNTMASFALAFTILFFIETWGSAAAIAVLESKSGFESLRQSANRRTEFLHHPFSIAYFTGFGVGTVLAYLPLSVRIGAAANWISILHSGTIYLLTSLMILVYVVANTVLYVQCKEASDEEIAKMTEEGEVSGECVRLVVNDDDGESLHELAKVGNGGFGYMYYLLCIVSAIISSVQLYYLYKNYSE